MLQGEFEAEALWLDKELRAGSGAGKMFATLTGIGVVLAAIGVGVLVVRKSKRRKAA
jgi:hypothetical protein